MVRAPMIAIILILFTSCVTTSPTPALLSGSPAEIDRLAGEWSGSYENPATGRTGSILFHLDSGGAGGDVVMFPLPYATRQPGDGRTAGPRVSGTVIGIKSVRFADGEVAGELEPYVDPETGHLVTTSFLGRVHADEIRGTFTMHSGTLVNALRGTWAVVRTSDHHSDHD